MNDKEFKIFENKIWLNSTEAAGYLSISVNALRIKVHKKQIPAYCAGRHLRFKKSDLDRYLKPLNGGLNVCK